MQSSNGKILRGFFTNIGADPFINWINGVFETANRIYCSSIYYITGNHADGVRNEWKYRVTKDDNKSLLFYDAYSHTKSIIINISDIPELLNIKFLGPSISTEKQVRPKISASTKHKPNPS